MEEEAVSASRRLLVRAVTVKSSTLLEVITAELTAATMACVRVSAYKLGLVW